MNSKSVGSWVFITVALAAFVGCSEVDRLGGKMDMESQHLSEKVPPIYQGRLQSKKKIGAMTAMEFADGTLYDVVDLSPGLVPGDIVRIYKVEKGYEARLWIAAKDDVPVPVSSGPVPTPAAETRP